MLFYIFAALLFDILILFVNASLTNCLQSLLAFFDQCVKVLTFVYVVVQFYPWFKFYLTLFLGMVMYDNEFETKGNKI